MKKIFAVVFMVLLGSFFVLAQTTQIWQTLAPADEEFLIETPTSVKRTVFYDDGSFSRYDGISNGTYFYIFSEDLKESFYDKVVKKFINLYQKGGKLEKIGECKTEKFEFADEEGFYHTVLNVKAEKRIYTFQIVSPTNDNLAVKRFFESIKITEKPLSVSINQPTEIAKVETEEKSTQITNNKNSPQIVSGGIGSGKGQGSGAGDGTGNSTTTSGIGTGKTNQTTALTNETKTLKILTKPRPNYTDFARFYGIQGTVTLRVTFLANGTIGVITPITRLPFGLTKESIETAKRMTFEPAMKNGVTYSVVKQVQFSFVIY